MKIIISGYGRMGKAVEEIALQRHHHIEAVLEEGFHKEQLYTFSKEAVVIDFSLPQVAAENMRKFLEAGLKVVVGTTGWYSHLPEIKTCCETNNGALVYGSNMSIGVNVMFHLNKSLATIMNRFPAYFPMIEETHHIHKVDAPSGTAITLAEEIVAENNRITDWAKKAESNKEKTLPVISYREGEVMGDHTVSYSSHFDTISLAHHAKSRVGFAEGAVLAAEWIIDKKGFFSMQEVLFGVQQ